MSNNNNPFPSLPPLHEWHEVPFNRTIPARTPYAYAPLDGEGLLGVNIGGAWDDLTHTPEIGRRRFTPSPILLRVPLPTEAGSQIVAIFKGDDEVPVALVRAEDGAWRDRSGLPWYPDEIVRWAPLPESLDWREVAE